MPDRRTLLVFLAIFTVAAGTRFHGIGMHTLWVDEANSVLTAQESFAGILHKLHTDSSPPLYYFLLKIWMSVFGDSEAAVRSLSACFSLGLVTLLFFVGARCFSPAVGLITAFVMATAPVQIYYSQQARMYTMLPFLALLSTWSLVLGLQTRARRPLVVFAVSSAVALYTHNFAFFLLPLYGLLVLWSGQLRERWLTWLIVFGSVAVAYLPWLSTFLEQLRNKDHYAWFEPFWNSSGTLDPVIYSLRSFSPGGEFLNVELMDFINWHMVPTVVGLGLLLTGCWALWRTHKTRPALAAIWVPCLLIVPAACSIISSALMTPNYVAGRVDQTVYPAYALLVGLGIHAIPTRIGRTVLILAIGVVGIASSLTYHPSHTGREVPLNDKDLAKSLVEHARPGDAVLFTSVSRAPIEYLLRRHKRTDLRLFNFPRDTANHLGSQNDARIAKDPRMQEEARQVLQDIRRHVGTKGRVFAILVEDKPLCPVNKPLMDVLNHGEMILDPASHDRVWQSGSMLKMTCISFRLK